MIARSFLLNKESARLVPYSTALEAWDLRKSYLKKHATVATTTYRDQLYARSSETRRGNLVLRSDLEYLSIVLNTPITYSRLLQGWSKER